MAKIIVEKITDKQILDRWGGIKMSHSHTFLFKVILYDLCRIGLKYMRDN
jgi:hypothetical protein